MSSWLAFIKAHKSSIIERSDLSRRAVRRALSSYTWIISGIRSLPLDKILGCIFPITSLHVAEVKYSKLEMNAHDPRARAFKPI